MKSKYHYEYMWVCVDMCNGGTKDGPYKSRFDAIFYKPKVGIWQLKKIRKYDN